MKEYQRNTKQSNFNSLPLETVQACRKYFEDHELEKIESNILLCCETTSSKVKQGFFGKLFGGGNFVHFTAVFFTPERLFWANTDQKNHIVVLSAKFSEVEITDFDSKLIEDNGLNVFGSIGHFKERVQAFIGFGEEPFANEFRRKLKETARK